MQLGLSVATRSGLAAARIAAHAAAAESAGADAFFVAERVADAVPIAQAALAATRTITVGTAVANARLRHPALLAMGAATVDELSGGRFLLGLGTANAALNEGTLGLPAVPPVAYMREYVDVLRKTLAGAPDAGGTVGHRVRGLRPDRPAANHRIPLFLAGLLPRMLRLAGEVADGALLNLTTPRSLPIAVRAVLDGAAAAGRRRSDLVVACVLPCCLGADEKLTRRTGQELVVGYALHPAAARLFAASGYGAELATAAQRLRDGDRPGALSVISDEMVDDFLLRGDPARVRARIEGYRAAGVDLPILFPVPGDSDWDTAVERTIDFISGLRSATTREESA
jgi:alkanesulfonate monooxygenase SsuD/methylene tetrahydromethanopterin reductase-like flavin-dependent oxidoreductase (luciferase family)